MSRSSKVWFITGCSSGFGLSMTKTALSKGDKVVATLRKPEVLAELAKQYHSSQLLVLMLDVSDMPSITEAFTQATKAFGRIDVVFNNAGGGLVAEAESTPMEEAKKLFDVNFWGAVAVSQEAIRVFRDVNPKGEGGVLIQNGSFTSVGILPCGSIYTASKHAFLGFSKTLQAELDPSWNIHITTVLFGVFDTNLLINTPGFPLHPAYAHLPHIQAIHGMVDKDAVPLGGSTDEATAAVYEIAYMPASERPPVIPLGMDAVGIVEGALNEMVESCKKTRYLSESLTKIDFMQQAADLEKSKSQ